MPNTSLPAFSRPSDAAHEQRLLDAVNLPRKEWGAKYPTYVSGFNTWHDSIYDAFDAGLCSREKAEHAVGERFAVNRSQFPSVWERIVTLPPAEFASGRHISKETARTLQRCTLEDLLKDGRVLNLPALTFYGLVPKSGHYAERPQIEAFAGEQLMLA